ncbi:hypothetical protein ANO11243_076010 [Dothideomycetidae sp. 11243]|nr:hypothetical protein ANO11243_076010 [fungal sp. No.11243]
MKRYVTVTIDAKVPNLGVAPLDQHDFTDNEVTHMIRNWQDWMRRPAFPIKAEIERKPSGGGAVVTRTGSVPRGWTKEMAVTWMHDFDKALREQLNASRKPALRISVTT